MSNSTFDTDEKLKVIGDNTNLNLEITNMDLYTEQIFLDTD